jgi:hypothetical protein
MTLQWDLSSTALARADSALKAPSEEVLFSLSVGMLLLEGISYRELIDRELVLHEDQLPALAEVFEYRIPELAREFGDSDDLRQRLMELIGIRVTRLNSIMR